VNTEQHELPAALPLAGLQKLAAALAPDEVRLVGGVVRDWLLCQHVTDDLDLATTATPTVVTERLQVAGYSVIPTGLSHGTVTVLLEQGGKRYPCEITTLREDTKTDGRHAEVTFTTDWATDARRRDFTINALYWDLDGMIYDYHTGLADLQKGVLRFVGEPQLRLQEDHLRLLRWARFYALLQSNHPAWQGQQAEALTAVALGQEILAQDVPNLKQIAAERLGQEWRKLLGYQRPEGAIELLAQWGVLALYDLPEPNITNLQELLLVAPKAVYLIRLMALFGSEMSWNKSPFLQLSQAERKWLQKLAQAMAEESFTQPWQLVYLYGREVAMASAQLRQDINLVSEIANVQELEFPLSGQDVMAAGIAAGPRVGEILAQLERYWLLHEAPERDVMLQQLTDFCAPL